jgi:hypothetical protein
MQKGRVQLTPLNDLSCVRHHFWKSSTPEVEVEVEMEVAGAGDLAGVATVLSTGRLGEVIGCGGMLGLIPPL